MQRRPLGRGEWLRTAQAFGRGLLYAVLLSLAALGAQHLARPLNPEWVILGFVLLLTLVVRKWPIVPHPKWWESVAATAGVFAVLLPMVLRAGASIPDALLLVVFLGAGLWQHQAERRPKLTDPPHPARDATWAP